MTSKISLPAKAGSLKSEAVQRERESRIARLEDKFRNELMSAEDRDELRSRIVRLRAKAAGR